MEQNGRYGSILGRLSRDTAVTHDQPCSTEFPANGRKLFFVFIALDTPCTLVPNRSDSGLPVAVHNRKLSSCRTSCRATSCVTRPPVLFQLTCIGTVSAN